MFDQMTVVEEHAVRLAGLLRPALLQGEGRLAVSNNRAFCASDYVTGEPGVVIMVVSEQEILDI